MRVVDELLNSTVKATERDGAFTSKLLAVLCPGAARVELSQMYSILPRHLSLASVRALTLAVCASFIVVACGGGSSESTPTSSSSSSSSSSSGGTTTYTVGGTISGLTGTGLVLTDSVSTHTASPAALAGSFTLTPAVNSGTTYNVTVTTPPSSPAQFCTVTGGSGTVTTANVTTVRVSCKNVGQYVFVANSFDHGGTGTIGVFAINATTGAVSAANGTPGTPAIVPAATDVNPTGLAVDPTGPYLYVANSGSSNLVTGPPKHISAGNDVATYTIGAGGTLLAGTPVGLANNDEPFSLAFDPAGPYLYVGNNDFNASGAIAAFNPTAGALGSQLLGSPYPAGNVPYGLAVDSTHAFVFVANVFDATVVVYPITGGTLPTSPPTADPAATLTGPYAVAASPTGQYVYITDVLALPATSPGTVTGYSYNGSGVLTKVASYPVGTGPEGIAIDPTGQFLYVSNAHDGTVSAFTISSVDGSLSSVGSPYTSTTTGVPSTTPTALAVDPSGQFLYVANGDDASITTFTIAAGKGALTLVGSGPVQANNGPGAGTSAIAID